MKSYDHLLPIQFEELLMSCTKSSLQTHKPCLHSALVIVAHIVLSVHDLPTAIKSWEKVPSYHSEEEINECQWVNKISEYRFSIDSLASIDLSH